MPPYKEKSTVKLYYSIGEVSSMFKVKPSLIRFWEKQFDIIKPKKNKKGNRLFTQNDVDNLNTIFHLVKECGYTLEGAKQKLKDSKSNIDSNVAAIKSLNKMKNFLLELKKEI